MMWWCDYLDFCILFVVVVFLVVVFVVGDVGE